MLISDRDAQLLFHILKHCYEIEQTHIFFGNSKKEFDNNFLYRNSISMPLQTIGTNAKGLSSEFVSSYNKIPWKQIGQTRNIIAHCYDDALDFNQVWESSQEDIQELKKYCKKILKENNRSTPKPPSIAKNRYR